MEIWESLTSTAVLGTERQQVNLAADGPLGIMLAKLRDQDKEHQLLGAAAVVSLYRRAGATPTVDSEPLPAPAPADGRPDCPSHARECLAVMMCGQHDEVLPEWLALLQGSGARVPEDYLSALLERGRQHGALRETIAAVAGERGRWLARQHPGWAYVAGETDTADFAARRRQDPARAREELAVEWPTLDPQARESRLPALAVGLGQDDESFLESALDDKRKEVRGAAADLLAQLPQSRFAQRMIARLEPLLAFTPAKPARLIPPSAGSKARLDVAPPAACNKAMQRDGIQAKIPAQIQYNLRNLGEKGWWLLQILSCVPPGEWCARWGQTPAELLKLVEGHDWQDAVRNGWAQAAMRFHDQEWAKALYPLMLVSNSIVGDWTELIAFLPPAYWEDITLKALFGKQADTEALPPVVGLLYACPHPWSTQLAAAVRQRIGELLKPSIFTENRWSGVSELLSKMLLVFAVKAPTALLPEAVESLLKTSPTIPESPFRSYWENTIESAVSLMQLRHEMQQAFNNG